MDGIAQTDAFFAGKPKQWELFETLRKNLCAAYPNTRLRVMKTCISFDDPKPYCYVSLPKKKVEDGLLVSVSLRERMAHPRILMLVPISKTRFTAHIPVRDVTEIDEDIVAIIALSRR